MSVPELFREAFKYRFKGLSHPRAIAEDIQFYRKTGGIPPYVSDYIRVTPNGVRGLPYYALMA